MSSKQHIMLPDLEQSVFESSNNLIQDIIQLIDTAQNLCGIN